MKIDDNATCLHFCYSSEIWTQWFPVFPNARAKTKAWGTESCICARSRLGIHSGPPSPELHPVGSGISSGHSDHGCTVTGCLWAEHSGERPRACPPELDTRMGAPFQRPLPRGWRCPRERTSAREPRTHWRDRIYAITCDNNFRWRALEKDNRERSSLIKNERSENIEFYQTLSKRL